MYTCKITPDDRNLDFHEVYGESPFEIGYLDRSRYILGTERMDTSEMEYIPGLVCRKGRELGISTPFNDAVIEIDRMINKGQIKMGPENFKLLQEKVGMQPKA